MARFQVDIKAKHQELVRQLMARLGGVSAGDAVGFLLETQGATALARLSPEICVPPPFATNSPPNATNYNVVGAAFSEEKSMSIPTWGQSPVARHELPQEETPVDAGSVLASLL